MCGVDPLDRGALRISTLSPTVKRLRSAIEVAEKGGTGLWIKCRCAECARYTSVLKGTGREVTAASGLREARGEAWNFRVAGHTDRCRRGRPEDGVQVVVIRPGHERKAARRLRNVNGLIHRFGSCLGKITLSAYVRRTAGSADVCLRHKEV